MHKVKSTLENETHKILWDFEIQMDKKIQARRSVIALVRKKKIISNLVCFTISAISRVKIKEIKRRENTSIQRTEEAVDHEGDVCHCHLHVQLWLVTLENRLGELEIRGRIEAIKTTALLILFTNPSARTGYDTRSIFKRSLTGLNSEFSFS